MFTPRSRMRAEHNTHNTVSADQMKHNQAQWNRKLRFCLISDNNNNKM